jgi:cold shock CspA family protein
MDIFGSPNVFVDKSVVESAGMNDLKGGQGIIFEIQRDQHAVSLKALQLAATPHLEDHFAITNPFDIISAFVSSTIPRLLPRP